MRPVPSRLTSPRALLFAGLLGTSACVSGSYMTHRGLHYVDDQLVETDPAPPLAYEAYIRARLALERDPPDLEAARGHIADALHWQSDEPHLWTLKAEIEWKAGDFAAAERSLAQALTLRPGYPEAQRLQAQIHDQIRDSKAQGQEAG